MRANIVCPDTSRPFSFEVNDDAKALAKNWNRLVRAACPHCDVVHAARYKEVYMDGVLSSFTNDFEAILIGARAARP